MRAINHAITGAIIGVTIDQPLVAIPLAFVSHFALDAVPHEGGDGRKKPLPLNGRIFRGTLLADALACGLLVVYLALAGASVLSMICAFVATSPDLMWLGMFLKAQKGKSHAHPQYAFARFHAWIQWYQRPPGIIIEVMYFFLSMTVLVRSLH